MRDGPMIMGTGKGNKEKGKGNEDIHLSNRSDNKDASDHQQGKGVFPLQEQESHCQTLKEENPRQIRNTNIPKAMLDV